VDQQEEKNIREKSPYVVDPLMIVDGGPDAQENDRQHQWIKRLQTPRKG